jgi:hypothetical protein
MAFNLSKPSIPMNKFSVSGSLMSEERNVLFSNSFLFIVVNCVNVRHMHGKIRYSFLMNY